MSTSGYAFQMYLLNEVFSTTVQLCSLCSCGRLFHTYSICCPSISYYWFLVYPFEMSDLELLIVKDIFYSEFCS